VAVEWAFSYSGYLLLSLSVFNSNKDTDSVLYSLCVECNRVLYY